MYKSVPFGSIDDTLPYLLRRLLENRSVLNGVRRERDLLSSALKHRMKQKLSPIWCLPRIVGIANSTSGVDHCRVQDINITLHILRLIYTYDIGMPILRISIIDNIFYYVNEQNKIQASFHLFHKIKLKYNFVMLLEYK